MSAENADTNKLSDNENEKGAKQEEADSNDPSGSAVENKEEDKVNNGATSSEQKLEQEQEEEQNAIKEREKEKEKEKEREEKEREEKEEEKRKLDEIGRRLHGYINADDTVAFIKEIKDLYSENAQGLNYIVNELESPLIVAASFANNLAIVEILIQHNADVNQILYYNANAVNGHIARPEVAKTFLELVFNFCFFCFGRFGWFDCVDFDF